MFPNNAAPFVAKLRTNLEQKISNTDRRNNPAKPWPSDIAYATRFQLAGTSRQFREILQLDSIELSNDLHETNSGKGLQRLVLAQTQLKSVSVTVGDAEYRAMTDVLAKKGEQSGYEKVFNGDFYPNFDWVERFIEISRSIVEVRSSQKTFYGTGFLVDGSAFNQSWGDQAIILTNEHLVSPNGMRGALTPGGTRVRFSRCSNSDIIRYRPHAIWSSPREEHDVTFLALPKDLLPTDAQPLQIGFGELLPKGQHQTLTVIGHPSGRKLSLAIENLGVIDHDCPVGGATDKPTRVQYQSATEPGSSGSPVFDWRTQELVAIHHKGGALDALGKNPHTGLKRRSSRRERMRRQGLSRPGGQRVLANQGVFIESIAQAILAHPQGYRRELLGYDD